jgi:hypothetical protein
MAATGSEPSSSKRSWLGRLVDYFANLSAGRLILWCYFIWYLVVLVRYFDPSPRLWLTALGLSLIIGIALLINTTRSGTGGQVRLQAWPIFRLFLTPFCVSSFAALVKSRGFILIFSPHAGELVTAVVLCLLFCSASVGAKRYRRRWPAPAVSGGPPDTSLGEWSTLG